MKSCSPELAEHLAQDSTTLAYLWKLKRQDGTVLTFTTHDEDILYPPGIDLSPAEKAQALLNASAVPPAPTLSGGSGGSNGTVYLTYLSEVIASGAVIPGMYTESLPSPGTIGLHNPTVASPPAPSSPAGAVAPAYNVYSTSDTTGAQLQNAAPIPLGTDFTISGYAEYHASRALPTETLLSLALIAREGEFVPGPDGYAGSAGGASASLIGVPPGNGIDHSTAYLKYFSLPPALGFAISAQVMWRSSFRSADVRLCIPNLDPCDNVPYAGSGTAEGLTVAGGGRSHSNIGDWKVADVAPSDLPTVIGTFYVIQNAPIVCVCDPQTDEFLITDFHAEVLYPLSAGVGGGGVFPLPKPESVSYTNHFSNTAKQSGSNL